MSTQVDDLKIKLEAEAKGAESELDKLINKVGTLEGKVSTFGKGGTGIAKAFSGLNKMKSYTESIAKDIAKSLIFNFDIKDSDARAKIEELSKKMVEEQVAATKSIIQTGEQAGHSYEPIAQQIESVIQANHNVRQSLAETETQWQDFYNILLKSSKVNIGEAGLKEMQYALGEWKNLDGLIKQTFSSKGGISLDTLFSDWDSQLQGKLSALGDTIGKDANNDKDRILIVVEALRRYREELEQMPKISERDVQEGVWDILIDGAQRANAAAKETFKTYEQGVAELKEKYGDIGKDFAEKGGINLKAPEAIQKAIDNATAQMHKKYEAAQLLDVNSTSFENTIKQAVVLENHVESLKRKLETLNMDEANGSAARMAATLATVDRVLAREAEERERIAQSIEEEEAAEVSLSNTIQSSPIAEKVKETQAATENMANSVEHAKEKYSTIGATIDFIRQKLQSSPSNLFAQLNLTKPKEEFLDIQAHIEETEKRLNKFKEMMARGFETTKNFGTTTTFRKYQYDIEEAENALKSFQSELDEMGWHTHQINWEGIGQKASGAFNTLGKIVSNTTRHMINLGKAISNRVSSGIKNMAKHLGNADLTSKGLVKSLLKVSNMLKLMITRMALRGVINQAKEGFNDLIQFSERTAASYNKMRNAIKYLADSLAAMISPIINASDSYIGLGNIVDIVADKIVDLANKINQLTAAMLGHSTWIKATKQTTDYANAAKKAGKEAKKALQPFDELNNITTNDDNSGNGGDAGAGGQYQELPIAKQWKDMADWIKEMWNKSDFTGLGTLIGEKLRDSLNKIPWSKIKKTMKKVGKSFATLLNGFFEVPGLAESIGKTIAEAFNSALEFGLEFVKNFHFDSFGLFIGRAIITAVRNINWDGLKEFASLLGKGLADAVNGLIESGAIAELGTAIGSILRSAIDFAFEFITNINWEGLGEQLSKALNNILDQLNAVDDTGLNGWQKLGKTISDGLIGILSTLNAVLGDEEARAKIEQGVTDFFEQIDFETIISESVELLENIAKGLWAVIKGAVKSDSFKSGLADLAPILGAVLAGILTVDALTVAFGGIKTAIGAPIGNAFTSAIAGTGAASVATGVTEAATGAEAAGAASAAGVTLGTILGGGVAATLAAVLGGEVGNLIGYTIFPDDAELYEEYSGIRGTLKLFKDTAITFAEETRDNVPEAWRLLKERTAEHAENLKKKISEFFSDTKSDSTQKAEDTKTNVSSKWETLKTNISQASDNTKKNITDNWTKIKEAVKGDVDIIKSDTESAFGDMKQNISEKIGDIYDDVTGVFSKIKEFVTGIVEDAKDWGGNLVSNIKEGINNTKDGLKNAVTNIGHAITGKEDGGVYVGQKWQKIQGFASGGYPTSAEMFLARENGTPEMVGRIGSHTAVANNDQIVASVSDGVYRAVLSAMSQTQNSGSQEVNVEITGDMGKLFKAIQRTGNEYQRRTGNTVFA